MTAPFPIEQPHSPLFDPRGLPHTEAARASNPENERMDQHHHLSPPAFFFTSTVRRHRDDSAHKRVLDVFTLAAWSDRSGVTVHSPT